MTVVRAIDTSYRGYRFRSRTEARWAVFFDAAGIEWQYEAEGFDIDGRRYLPDFVLPQLELTVEIKPNGFKASNTPLLALVGATGKPGLLIIGSPSVSDRPRLYLVRRSTHDGRPYLQPTRWYQCRLCNHIDVRDDCNCVPMFTVLQDQEGDRWPRVEHALREAQRARFEHGENGRPRPYAGSASRQTVKVYVAGTVLGTAHEECGCDEAERQKCPFREGGETRCTFYSDFVQPWRAVIWGDDELRAGERRIGRFEYAGPSILTQHGYACESCAEDCLAEVAEADILFVWIDDFNTLGTLAEVGAAYALGKPIIVAFADRAFADHFYFIRQLAMAAIIAPTASIAWRYFTQWNDR